MTRLLAIPASLAVALGCGSTCEVDAPLDYTEDRHWMCSPDHGTCNRPSTVHRVSPRGETQRQTVRPATEPALACFVLYPTLDLRLGVGLHHQTSRIERAERWVHGPPRLLNTACTIYAPVYRQVTVGTYAGDATPRKDRCFDSAYRDVDAAFSAFLRQIGDRPFALFGHSQGAQHLTRLLRDRVEGDPALRDRLVVAWPLGWSLSTAEGSETGGSFDQLPVCTRADQTACVMGYRSYLAGQARPEQGRFFEGHTQVCTHPSAPESGDGPLAAFVTRHDDGYLAKRPSVARDGPHDLLWWDQRLDATCRGDADSQALAVRWHADAGDEAPFEQASNPLIPDNGTHLHDVSLGIVDIADDLGRRAQAWQARP